jgi:hypothetical protein
METLRFYLANGAGLFRLSVEFMEYKRPLRQLAGQSIKVVEVLYSGSGDHVRVHHAWGMIISVDRSGMLSRANLEAVAAAMDVADIRERSKRMSVPDIGQLRKKQIEFDRCRWKPTSAQLGSIMADLTGTKPTPLASRQLSTVWKNAGMPSHPIITDREAEIRRQLRRLNAALAGLRKIRRINKELAALIDERQRLIARQAAENLPL